MITEMWCISVDLRAKGPPAPERPFAEQNRASGGAKLFILKIEEPALQSQELKRSPPLLLVLANAEPRRVWPLLAPLKHLGDLGGRRSCFLVGSDESNIKLLLHGH